MDGYLIDIVAATSDGKEIPAKGWMIPRRGMFGWHIVGESYYQPALLKLAGKLDDKNGAEGVELQAVLYPNPLNKYDKRAVEILIGGQLVGHLSRDDSELFHDDMELIRAEEDRNCRLMICQARLTGGFLKRDGTRATVGVVLDIDFPTID